MKKFKKFINELNIDDFEEDFKGRKSTNTDAMKRYKAGKAGFTDKAHLKAKGLIQSQMVQKGSLISISKRKK